ncbi:50S ribosomal protein L28 [Bifidobacterium aquikefiri]|uniref:50S ribosomal protein L28 n=1 Tax=Bifidobacterium aquikefiri TaxID=1653207 RepID=UPI000B9B1267|nr:50S ribosomal protein L28 [Bifidobacterium aquikefiri]
MAKTCQVLGIHVSFGNSVSHSHRRTRRRFQPNLQRKRYWVPSLNRFIALEVSARGIKTIDRRGIETVVAQLRARGDLSI